MEDDPYYNYCGRGFYFGKQGKIKLGLVTQKEMQFH